MQSTNNLRDEQWDLCDRCGFRYPMSLLVMQKGTLVCTVMCVDNLDVERRPAEIASILGTEVQEGVDTRELDRAFFDTRYEEAY